MDDVAVRSGGLRVVHLGNGRVIGLQVSLDIGHGSGGKGPGDVGLTLDFDDGVSHDGDSSCVFVRLHYTSGNELGKYLAQTNYTRELE